MKSNVLIIYTGGTIGMAEDPETGSLIPLNFEHLSAQIPELKKFDIELSMHSFAEPIDSSNMDPLIWVNLAQIVQARYAEFDGFVILHGTDTMAYTASALSFMLLNLAKPVILTGSQLPIGTIRTDGKENLLTAIEIAVAKENGLPIVSEVAIYFEYQLLRGNRTRKYNTEHFDAFQSPNYPQLAEAGIKIAYNKNSLLTAGTKSLRLQLSYNPNVFILKLFPGINPEMIAYILQAPNLAGLVLETFGAGNCSSNPQFIAALKQLVDRGIPVLNITQCYGGSVMQGRYETSVALQEIGVISGYDISTEAAVCKMMLLLGQKLTGQALKQALQTSIAGEITEPN